MQHAGKPISTKEKGLYEKAYEGTLTPEDIEAHEIENFKKEMRRKNET